MRLDFNVLWVDDQPKQLQAQIAAISRQMSEHGFKFNPTVRHSLEEVRTLISDDIFTDEVDLILVDWDLGGGLKGQDVISAIRENIQYKEVVFYSSLTSASELRRLAFDVEAEGIYCASKGNIVEEVIGVFEGLVKKVLDLDHTRGIVMGATSDIDHMALECLNCIHDQSVEDVRAEMLNKARKMVEKKIADLNKKSAELKEATSIASLLKAHALFTANDRLRVLNTALQAKDFDGHATLRTGLKAYITDVVPKRNDLGHVILVPEGKPGVLADVEGKVVSLEDMRVLRKTLLELRGNFRALRDSLQSPK